MDFFSSYWCFRRLFYYSSSNLNLLFSSLLFLLRFEIETEHEIFEEVLYGDLDFSSDPWPNISESAKDLVRKMLVRNPRKRITAHEVLCKLFLFFLFPPLRIYLRIIMIVIVWQAPSQQMA